MDPFDLLKPSVRRPIVVCIVALAQLSIAAGALKGGQSDNLAATIPSITSPYLLTSQAQTEILTRLGKLTGSKEAIAGALRDPRYSASAEISAGGRIAEMPFLPSIQLGNDNGKGTGGITFTPPGRLANATSFKAEFKPGDEKPAVGAKFRGQLVDAGGLVKGVTIYLQYSVEFAYKDKLGYLRALGVDSSSLPGAQTTLKAMDKFTTAWNSRASSESSLASAATNAAKAAQAALQAVRQVAMPTLSVPGSQITLGAMGAANAARGSIAVVSPASRSQTVSGANPAAAALASLKEQATPAIFQAASQYDTVTVGTGYVLILDKEAAKKFGVLPGASLTVSEMFMTRMDARDPSAKPVTFTESAMGVSLSAQKEFAAGNAVVGEGKIEGSVEFKTTTDPDEVSRPVSASREKMARSMETGDFAGAMSQSLDYLSPVTKGQEIQDYISLLEGKFGDGKVGGVKMRFDDAILARVINGRPVGESVRAIDAATRALDRASTGAQRQQVLADLTLQLNRSYKATKHSRTFDHLAVISVKYLADQAQAYQGRWGDLPDELRHPGGITRIIGYHADPGRQDILIVGTLDPVSPPIELDDLIVGLRAVYRDHEPPFCSLDPEPDDFTAPQHVRVGGVPDDSSFAHVMIEADYAMKRLMFGVLEPGTAEFESLATIYQRLGSLHDFTSRAWLYPIQPARGDIQISSDQMTVLFLSNIEVLSEEMVHCREGLVGTGSPVSVVETSAESFTQCYPAIAAKHSIFGQLKGLFDIALLGTLWEKTGVKCEAIDRLVELPYRHAPLPASYPAVTVQLPGSQVVTTLSGGVELRMAVNPDLFLTLDDPAFAALAGRYPDGANTAVASPLDGIALDVQDPFSQEWTLRRHLRTAAFAKLEAGDAAGAANDLTALLGSEPDDPALLSTRAFAYFMGVNFMAARADANAARALDPANPDSLQLASTVLFLLDTVEGHPAQALSEIDQALGRDPASVRGRILRGDALAVLGQKDGARKEFKLAIAEDPTLALPYIQLAVLELSEGWIVKGMNLVRKAERVAKLSREGAAVKAALALAEVENAALGDVDQRFASGVNYANEALGDPACDPESKILASSAIMAVAVYHSDWGEVEQCLQRVEKIVPWNPDLLVAAAEAAHEQKRDDLARGFLARARHIAPDNPAVKGALPSLTE